MIDIEQAEHFEVGTDADGRVWVNVNGECVLRIKEVATLQLRPSSEQYISHTKGMIVIARRHKSGEENCWCGKSHVPNQQVKQAKPYVVK